MSQPTLEDVTVRGLRFSCLVQGEGPLVLCLHGFPDTASAWGPTLALLAARGYRGVAPALRGYAPSAIPEDGDYHPLTLGQDVLGLMDAFGASTATLVGHDWGAMAAHVAAGLAPERVSRLVTVAIPHPRALRPSLKIAWRARHFITFQWKGRATRQLRGRDGAFVDTIYRRWSPTWAFDPSATAPFRAMMREPGRAEATLGYYWAFPKSREGERGAALQAALRVKLPMPSLAFCGADDGATRPAMFEAARSRYAAAYDWVLVEGAGHFPHREKPELFHERLLAFLGAPGGR